MKYLGKGGTFVRIRENKKHFILFYMLGFFIGIVYANLMSKDYITSMGIFNEFFLSQYMQADVDVAEYIWYVVRIRVAPVAVICALGCTRLRKLVVALFLLWTGRARRFFMTWYPLCAASIICPCCWYPTTWPMWSSLPPGLRCWIKPFFWRERPAR